MVVERHDTIDAYIASFPSDTRLVLDEVLRRFRAAAPDAIESVSYGMPTFRLLNGRPVYFAAWKKHLSLHDIPVFADPLESRSALPIRQGHPEVPLQISHPLRPHRRSPRHHQRPPHPWLGSTAPARTKPGKPNM